jgi:hypothetical protein
MQEQVSVQGIPVGGVHIVRQSVATDTLTFHAEQNGLAIAVILRSTPPSAEAPVVKAQRNPNCFTKAERTHRRAAVHHALNSDGARDEASILWTAPPPITRSPRPSRQCAGLWARYV